MQLKIEYLSIDEIKPYSMNSKLHPAEQIEQIKKSIQDFGFNDPIGIWNGEIIEGHGRYIAAQELGIDTVPVIRLDGLSNEQRRAYALVHNKLTMNSGFDFDLLQLELDSLDLDLGEFGFDNTAFDESALNDLFTDAPETIIEPYEKTLISAKTVEVKKWSAMVYRQLLNEVKQGRISFNDKAVFLCGKPYRKYIECLFKSHEAPLSHLGIGKQLKFYKENT